MRSIGLVLALGACGDKAVQLSILPPAGAAATDFDPSCVRSVQVYLNGGTYPDDDKDWALDCIELTTPQTTFTGIRDALEGQIDVSFPATGLSGVELWGFTGPCTAEEERDFDLIFYASAAHIGGDELSMTMVPNLSCAPTDVRLKPIDILKLSKGGCAMASWTVGKLGLATLSPLPFTDFTTWWGGSAAPIVGGVASVRGNVKAGARSCLAAGLYNVDAWTHVTCLPPADQRACATGADLEVPLIDFAVWKASQNQVQFAEYSGLVIGAVYGTAPVMGATVILDDADKELGEVVYFDMPPGVENGTGALTVRPGTSTGPSGLFGIYTHAAIRISVTANGRTVQRSISGNDEGAVSVVIKL